MTPLTEVERRTVWGLAEDWYGSYGDVVSIEDAVALHEAIYLAGKAAGREAGIIECSSLCGQRAHDHRKENDAVDRIMAIEAADCATACRALLKESE